MRFSIEHVEGFDAGGEIAEVGFDASFEESADYFREDQLAGLGLGENFVDCGGGHCLSFGSFGWELVQVVCVYQLLEGCDEGFVLLGCERFEELVVVAVGDGGEFWDESAACGGERDALIAAVVAAFLARDELFDYEALDELGDCATGQACLLRERTWRHLVGVEDLAKDDPFRCGDSAVEEFLCEGVGDVVGDEAEPEADVTSQFAYGRLGWLLFAHVEKIDWISFLVN